MRTDSDALADPAVHRRILDLWKSQPTTKPPCNPLEPYLLRVPEVVYHLEAALLERWTYFAINTLKDGFAVFGPVARDDGDEAEGPSRLEALLAACEGMQ